MLKKTIYLMVIVMFLFVLYLTHCSPSKLISSALNTDINANKDLDKTDKRYLMDVKNYKKEMSGKIDSIDQDIEIFKVRIEDNNLNAKYLKSIDAIEQQNINLKKKLNDYKLEGNIKWEVWKSDFNQSMTEMNYSYKHLINDMKNH